MCLISNFIWYRKEKLQVIATLIQRDNMKFIYLFDAAFYWMAIWSLPELVKHRHGHQQESAGQPSSQPATTTTNKHGLQVSRRSLMLSDILRNSRSAMRDRGDQVGREVELEMVQVMPEQTSSLQTPAWSVWPTFVWHRRRFDRIRSQTFQHLPLQLPPGRSRRRRRRQHSMGSAANQIEWPCAPTAACWFPLAPNIDDLCLQRGGPAKVPHPGSYAVVVRSPRPHPVRTWTSMDFTRLAFHFDPSNEPVKRQHWRTNEKSVHRERGTPATSAFDLECDLPARNWMKEPQHLGRQTLISISRRDSVGGMKHTCRRPTKISTRLLCSKLASVVRERKHPFSERKTDEVKIENGYATHTDVHCHCLLQPSTWLAPNEFKSPTSWDTGEPANTMNEH